VALDVDRARRGVLPDVDMDVDTGRPAVPDVAGPGRQRWSRKFGPVVKVDCLMRETIQNDEEKEPCAGVQSQGCA
jgi:hypothetical protein